jgi:hypothetical protein
VNAGEWFKANDIDYRVRALQNDGHRLVVEIDARNTEQSPHAVGRAIFELVAHAGDREYAMKCGDACLADVLRPGEHHTYYYQFAVSRPVDSLEFVDTSADIDPLRRVALVRLRPSSH